MVLTFLVGSCGGGPKGSTAPSPAPAASTFAEEFDGPADAPPNAARWTYDLGNNGGWGNQELESYTSSPQNVHLDGSGHLVIHVDRAGGAYTSARIKTQGLFSAQYGRVEARIRLPFFLILNVAVGGTFPGNPDETTTFPQEMVVDYVRVTPLS